MDENFLKMLASETSLSIEKYGNLHTVFSSTGIRAQVLGIRPCFGNVLKYTTGYMHNTYTIITFKSLTGNNNNLCIYSKEEIEEYLNYIAAFIPFTFTVSEFEENKEEVPSKRAPHFEIFVDITGPHIKHVFILTLIRYLYETPYKYILLEAFRMKKADEFSKINLLNLYNVIMFSIDWHSLKGVCPTDDMSHYVGLEPVIFLTKKEIQERLQNLDAEASKKQEALIKADKVEEWYKGRSVNAGCIDLFPKLQLSKMPDYISWRDKVSFYTPFGFKFITVEESLLKSTILSNTDTEFQKRLAVYANNLKTIASFITEDCLERSKKTNLESLRLFYTYAE